jgi:cell filamentation protein
VRLHLSFDLDHLRLLHRWLFGDVYAWAGEIRTIPIIKDRSEFANPRFIESGANELFKKLRQERALRNVAMSDLPARLAYYFGELNALHPFREGNGRTQRLFLRQLLKARGLHLSWDQVSADEIVAVSVAVHIGNDAPLCKLFERIVKPISAPG